MNPTKTDEFELTISSQDLKKRFCKIYENVISNYFIFNKELISSVKEILTSPIEDSNFKSHLPSYQLAFLLSYGVQDSWLAVETFYEAVMDFSEIIKNLSENKQIKLFCVQSESLPTVIGICQVLDEILVGKFACDYYKIQITVMDERENWRYLCGSIVDTVNSYFKNIEFKLDFVEDFRDWSCQDLCSRMSEIDLVIEARRYSENLVFAENDSFMQVVLREMKHNAVLFYFDSWNEWYYDYLKYLISKTKSFSQGQWCSGMIVSFEDLENEELHLDLPINWNITDYEPVMFSIWIKDAIPENHKFKKIQTLLIASQPDSPSLKISRRKGKKKRKSSKIHHTSDISTVVTTESDATEHKLCPTLDVSRMESTIPNELVSGSKIDKSSLITEAVISQKVITETPVSSTKDVSCMNSTIPTTQALLPNKENKCSSNVLSTSSKKITSKKSEPGKASPTVTKETIIKKEKLVKPAEKSSKISNTDSKTSKVKSEIKPNNASVPVAKKVKSKTPVPVQRTKKSVKTLPCDKIRLTGKFAYIDLEKKNKDERHKMKAKKASFSKYTDFDYDD